MMLGLPVVLLAVEGARKLSRSRSPPYPGKRHGLTVTNPNLNLVNTPPSPCLGNVVHMNKDAPHLTCKAWSKTYGDIVYTCMLGQHILQNLKRVAIVLLEKRSQKYSDRPVFSARVLTVHSLEAYNPPQQTHAILPAYIYLMMKHHTQAEINRVVRRKLLPGFEDQAFLP
ncbi:hypothetical protein OG21DRAFT_369470 [Imleria badia]|nr:hypothetical protein OG21DRAFT_369470 [Imleria badia]